MKKWWEYRAGTEEAILPVADIMTILSTPRHTARLQGHYISSAADYAPLFVKRLKEVTKNASFWNPTPL